MYFCGVDPGSLSGVYSHLESSSLTTFRNRIGDKGFSQVEAVIRQYLVVKKLVDTAVMATNSSCLEKHISYPTDSGLLDRGRKNLLRAMKDLKALGVKGVKGLRSFTRSPERAVLLIAKLGKGRQYRTQKSPLKLAKTASHLVHKSQEMLRLYQKALKKGAIANLRCAKKSANYLLKQGKLVAHVIKQARARYRGQHLKRKIYSLHDPFVVCIRKVKKRRLNEYGIKFNLSVDKNEFIISHEEPTKNIHDAKLLKPALKHWEKVTGCLPD